MSRINSRKVKIQATIFLNSKLDPSKSNWLKVDDCGSVLEEKPEKVIEALGLFLQGIGYSIKIGKCIQETRQRYRLSLQLKGTY